MPGKRTAEELPLVIALEGQCWALTAVLSTGIALWMVELETAGMGDTGNSWFQELVRYLALMLVAAVVAGIGFGALTMNIKPPGAVDWRRRSCHSSVALCFLNVLAAWQIIVVAGDAYDAYAGGKNDKPWRSPPAHLLLVAMALGCTLVSDIIFIRMFGFCTCCTLGADVERLGSRLKTFHADTGTWWSKFLGSSTTLDDSMASPPDIEPAFNQSNNPATDRNETREGGAGISIDNISCRLSESREEHSIGLGFFSPTQALFEMDLWAGPTKDLGSCRCIQESSGKCPEEAGEISISQENTKGLNPFQRARDQRFESQQSLRSAFSAPISAVGSKNVSGQPSKLKRWDTGILRGKSWERSITSNGPGNHSKDLEYTLNKDSRLLLENGAKVPAKECLSDEKSHTTFQRCMVCMNEVIKDPSMFLKRSSSLLQSAWASVREEEGVFKYSVWIKSAVFTSAFLLIFHCVRTIHIIEYYVDDWAEYRTRISNNLTKLDELLREAGWIDGVDDAKRNNLIKVLLYVDSVIPGFRWTVIAGYMLGLIIGLHSLFHVMAQHKRMSQVATDRILEREGDIPIDAGIREINPWPGIEKKYPITNAVYFLAIISSTAVLQLHIFGFLISTVLAVLVNFRELGTILGLFGFYIMAWVIIFIIDLLLMTYIPNRLLVSDGLNIKHPRFFFFYILVFSSVHLIIGLLYALWRVVYLIVTTIIVINRLDVCLFTTGKSLDNGHNAFMSMLVLTHLIQMDTQICRRQVTRELTARASASGVDSSRCTDNT